MGKIIRNFWDFFILFKKSCVTQSNFTFFFSHYLREFSKDFTDVTMIILKKKPKTTKSRDHRTICLIAHTANGVAWILMKN
jgi:hypothetical protein